MADAKARREARMRRILANSENRLKKISGKNSEDSDGTSRSVLDTDDEQTQNIRQNINGVALGGKYVEVDSKTSKDKDTDVATCSDFYPESYTHQYSDTSNWVDDSLDDTNIEFNFEQYTVTEREQAALNRKADLAAEVRKSKLICRILRNSTIYVVLAAIVNLLMFLNLDHLYGKAFFIPFFTVIMARILIPGSIDESEKGSLLVAALILCNIKPEVAYNIKWTVNVIHTMVTDFAVYVFSFVIMYSGIAYILGEYTDQHFSTK